MYAGIVLAAGASRRLGSPKALARIGSETAVERVCRTMKAAGCDEIRVVMGADEARIRPALPTFARGVGHPGWQTGRTGSLKAGLRTLDRTCCILVWPVDHPLVDAMTVSLVLDGPGDIRIPTHQGRRGHPTLFESSLREEILALADDQPLHDVVHRDPRRVVEVPVDDPGVLLNVDTPDDLKKLQALEARSKHAGPPA